MAPVPPIIDPKPAQEAELLRVLKEMSGDFFEQVATLALKDGKLYEDRHQVEESLALSELQSQLEEKLIKEKISDRVFVKFNPGESGKFEIIVDWPKSADMKLMGSAAQNMLFGHDVGPDRLNFYPGKLSYTIDKNATPEKKNEQINQVRENADKARKIAIELIAATIVEQGKIEGRRQYRKIHEDNLQKMVNALPNEKQAAFRLLEDQAKKALKERNDAYEVINQVIRAVGHLTPEVLNKKAKEIEESASKYQLEEKLTNSIPNLRKAAGAQQKLYDAYEKLEPLLIEGAKAAKMGEKETKLAIYHTRKNIYDFDFADGRDGKWQEGKGIMYRDDKPIILDKPQPPNDKAPTEYSEIEVSNLPLTVNIAGKANFGIKRPASDSIGMG